MKFRAGALEFNASVAESSQSPSSRTGDLLHTLTIQFRAQKPAMHDQALEEARQCQTGGLFSLDESQASEVEWRVRESSSTYVGTEPWGINHHTWRIEQVERIACQRLVLGSLELEPYEYVEAVLPSGGVALAARAAISAEGLDAVSRVSGPIDVLRVGVSDTPRSMLLEYLWGERPDGLVIVVRCEDLVEPRLTLAGLEGEPLDRLEEVMALTGVDGQELRRYRHARRRVSNIEGWDLMK